MPRILGPFVAGVGAAGRRSLYAKAFIYARGSNWGCVFSGLFVGNTLSCSHTVAVCSIMVPH